MSSASLNLHVTSDKLNRGGQPSIGPRAHKVADGWRLLRRRTSYLIRLFYWLLRHDSIWIAAWITEFEGHTWK